MASEAGQTVESTRTVESLGKIKKVLKPKTENVVAGLIIATLIAVPGCLITWSGLKQLMRGVDSGGALIAIAIGIAILAGGLYFAYRMHLLRTSTVTICQEGFIANKRNERTIFAWEEIVEVREIIAQEHLPIAKGPIAKAAPMPQKACAYSVIRCDGKSFDFDANNVPRTSLLAGPIKTASKRHAFEVTTVEM